jgi:transcriptional regulator with XRE-family HTH domain
VDNIGQRLKEERQFRGWSQRDLARETGVNTDTISGIETGQHEPRPSTLRKLAEGLGIEVRDLFMEAALPKAPAPSTPGQLKEERPIFDLVHDAVLKQAEQNRQAFTRAAESELPQTFWMRHENDAMQRLVEYNPGDVAEAYIELMKRYVQLEQEQDQLTKQVERLERRLEGVGA